MKALSAIAAAVGLIMAQPAGAESIQANGVELHYTISGSGEPLVLLHGFGSCAKGWGPIAGELSKRYRVIALDARGHGSSTNPSGRFTHAQAAEDVRALLDRLGIAKARAIGFSSGGMTLLHLATRYPDRLSKMVVIGATTHFGDQARAIMTSVASEGLPPPIMAMFEQCAARGPAQARDLVRQFGEFRNSRDDMNFSAVRLATIKASTLIVHGDRDEFFPVSIPVAMYEAIPGSALWIVPKGDHSPTAGASETDFLETIVKFLAP